MKNHDFFVKHHYFRKNSGGFFLGNIWKNLATFDSIIWSYCSRHTHSLYVCLLKINSSQPPTFTNPQKLSPSTKASFLSLTLFCKFSPIHSYLRSFFLTTSNCQPNGKLRRPDTNTINPIWP